MKSEELLGMLERAIREKQDAQKSYEKYHQQMNNPTLKKVVQGVLQREEEHLEILNTLRESIRANGNLEETALLGSGLLRNSANHDQHMELLKMVMQEVGSGLVTDNEIGSEEVEEEMMISPVDVNANRAAKRINTPAGSMTRYSRNAYNNRSVVNCSFGSPKTTLKKR